MSILAWDQENDIAIEPRRHPNAGEWCRIKNGKRITKKQYHPEVEVDTEAVELAWCENELIRVKQTSISSYRTALSEYKSNLNGDRPIL